MKKTTFIADFLLSLLSVGFVPPYEKLAYCTVFYFIFKIWAKKVLPIRALKNIYIPNSGT